MSRHRYVNPATSWRRVAVAGWTVAVLVAIGYASLLTWTPALLCV